MQQAKKRVKLSPEVYEDSAGQEVEETSETEKEGAMRQERDQESIVYRNLSEHVIKIKAFPVYPFIHSTNIY